MRVAQICGVRLHTHLIQNDEIAATVSKNSLARRFMICSLVALFQTGAGNGAGTASHSIAGSMPIFPTTV